MTISSSKKLTADHIRYATPTQIGRLIDKNPNTISRWNRRGFKTTDIGIVYPCIEQEDLITGLIRRREDFKKVENFQKEFDEILNSSEKLEEVLSA